MDKVRVLLIGVGGIARARHIPQLREVPEAAWRSVQSGQPVAL